jgi:hypothetical protein
MNWKTTICDIHHIENTSQYFLLAGVDQDYFGASAVFIFDLNAPDTWDKIKIPLTPVFWASMAYNCAGYEFILTGGEWMHHTWNNNLLTAHPQDIVFTSNPLWRVNADMAIYCGGNQLVTVSNQSATTELLLNTPRLACIHGIEHKFYVIGGDKGYLLINRGQGWRQIEDVPILTNIVDVHCVSENEIYLCAGYGGVFRWDGDSKWHRYETSSETFYGSEAFMYSLCAYKGRICVASLHLKNYWLDNTEAVPIEGSKVATRFKTDGQLLFGLGMNKFEVFDGETWRVFELDLYKLFPQELEAMFAAAPSP